MGSTASDLRKLIEDEGVIKAASRFVTCKTEQAAQAFIYQYIHKLLANGNYGAAALVLWGQFVFNPKPESVQRVWKACSRNALNLIQGAGSQGKSFTVIAWHLLDWWRDPLFTSVKIISTTKSHASSNTFSTLEMLHREAVVPMPGEITSGFLGLPDTEDRASISIVGIPAGESGRGTLKGFHPIPRSTPHPIFGRSSRVRAFLDEAEDIPEGAWMEVMNMVGNVSGSDIIKITAAYNPKDVGSKVARLAQPIQGWEACDPDTLMEWKSKEGWNVTRLDSAQSENVRERKEVFTGLQTYEGYRILELSNGGNSPELWTMGRGWYPPQGVNDAIISSGLLGSVRGEFIFTSSAIKCAGADIAIDGRDNAVLAVGRFGDAIAFIHHSIDPQTQRMVKNRINFKEPRKCLQVDQLLLLRKGSAEIVATDIKTQCIAIGIAPEWLCIDSTGNGSPVLGLLHAPSFWSADVQGVDFSKPATETKILEQDKSLASEEFEGVHTEVWFAMRRWMEFSSMALSPTIRRDPMEEELLGRRYKQAEGKRLRVEKKDDYKNRLQGRSPDFADALSIILHGVRMHSGVKISSTGQKEQRKPTDYRKFQHGHVDQGIQQIDDGV